MGSGDFNCGSFGCVHFFLTLVRKALCEWLFLDFFRLTSHRGLVGHELDCLEADSINWNSHTVLYVDDVADVQIVVVDNFDLAVAYAANLNLN